MKQRLTTFYALVTLAVLVGCAKNNDIAAVPGAPVIPPPIVPSTGPTPDPGATGDTSGATVSLNVTGSALSSFFFQSPPNNPTNVRFKMKIGPETQGYSGEVTISFLDGGVQRSATMSTTHPWSGHSDPTKNVWSNFGGKVAWHGFFQDYYGAVVVVIDQSAGLGDGSASLVGGSVWFQNFDGALPPEGPARMCWEIQIGPYDCRTFISGGTGDNGYTDTASSLYPNNHGDDRPAYRKLGDFLGLNKHAAMGD